MPLNLDSRSAVPRSSLIAAAARADEIGWGDLWAVITREQREEALRTFLDHGQQRNVRQVLAQAIVKGARGYSLNKLLGRPNPELARIANTLRRLPDGLDCGVLTTWLLERHGLLQRTFFEATGNGAACDEYGTATTNDFGTTDPVMTQAGFDAVLAADDDVGLLYLLALGVGFADRWSGIHTSLRQWASRAAPTELPAEPAPPTVLPAESPAALPTPPSSSATDDDEPHPLPVQPVGSDQRLRPVPEPQLTILDDLLTKTILSAWARAEHGLSRDELFALLDEVVYTNTERRRTNYHLGFADALFDEPWRDQLSARSEERRAWYAAGYLMGVARRSDAEQVAVCFDQQPDAQLLVQKPWPPFQAAADAILPALVTAQRHDALARMAPVVILFSLSAIEMIGEQGRSALERRDPGMALAFLQPAVASLSARLAAIPAGRAARERARLERLHHDLRRRLAHAYRLTGASEAAREMLQALRETERDEVIRGMILTDLALLGAGLRELAEVMVPDDRARHAELASLFEPVQQLLHDAMTEYAAPAAHAAYVLGVLSLWRGDWIDAAANLRTALNAFEARPMAYTGRGVLRQARLYTATAELLAIAEVEVARRAAERLVDLVQAGERPPRCFLEELVGNALLVDRTVGEALVAALLDQKIVSLETLAGFGGATEHAQLATAMTAAALDEGRSRGTRTDLAYCALPALVRAGETDSVDALLGVLEDGAANGVAVERYLDFLENQRELWESCWDRVDAKWSAIRVHLSNGQSAQARDCARAAFYAVIGNAQHRYDWVGEAEDLIEALCRSGADDADVAQLRRHLPQLPAECVSISFRPNARHTILVVGGNEAQRRFEEELEASLQAEYGGVIRMKFHTTGMASGWNRQLEIVERLLPEVDGVVISRFIRTNFGRNLRRQLGTRPWRTCGSPGMGRVRSLIVELAGELERRAAGG